ncbi:MAG TPA: nucleotidyl transferase AbiEii/AbiGii toxin family protein, partial [Victivallales bacterium]|nr:nucleotidyl transferase AbiEii/AbiGii toxin family protein [Victivallales bacterium]
MNLVRARNLDPNRTLKLYAIERLLFRLSRSRHRDRFILKGAMMFAIWDARIHRPTQDMDLLWCGNMSTESVREMFVQIIETPVEPDGLVFDKDSIAVEDIRAEDEYVGKRLMILAKLGTAKITVQIDIGIGDAVEVPFKVEKFPTLLSFPSPEILTYTKEPMIAEKFQAMVERGMGNSRMKDYFDIWTLTRHFPFDAGILRKSIEATFSRRSCPMPLKMPVGLTAEFGEARDKGAQWKGFLRRIGAKHEKSFPEVVADIADFLCPVLFPSEVKLPSAMEWNPKTSRWEDKSKQTKKKG